MTMQEIRERGRKGGLAVIKKYPTLMSQNGKVGGKRTQRNKKAMLKRCKAGGRMTAMLFPHSTRQHWGRYGAHCRHHSKSKKMRSLKCEFCLEAAHLEAN